MARIIVLCATRRGLKALQTIAAAADSAELCVVSYSEYPGEPLFLDDIHRFSIESGYEFYTVSEIQSRGWEVTAGAGFDLLIAVSWRYMVPESFYSQARLGAYVFHDSMLPRYRGFSPSLWAVMNGESETGMTLFRMDRTVDSGLIVAQSPIPIEESDDIGTLRAKGTEAMARILKDYLPALIEGRVEGAPQDEREATYACKWLPEDSRIDWTRTSREIHNLIRATTRPYPGAYCKLGSDKLTVWRAELPANPKKYVGRVVGRVVEIDEDGVVVLTGDSVLRLIEVSLNGDSAVPASRLLTNYSITLC